MPKRPLVEWPTVLLMIVTYAVWALGTSLVYNWLPPLGFALTVLAITQFSSLQHEVLHGHPFRSQRLSDALVFPALTVFVPYIRFRDMHLAHHRDERLTDPYDDPESNYLDPNVWARLPLPMQKLLRANNTLLGRMTLGPAISTFAFLKDDFQAIWGGDRSVLEAWLAHAGGLLLLFIWLWSVPGMGVWIYFCAAYAAYGILKIRTFLEHRAHEKARGRTVIVERGGIFGVLFLYNNLHAVHHTKPKVAWYQLPSIYREKKKEYLRRNDSYFYQSYGEIFRQYFLKAKDPVPHPLMTEQVGQDVSEVSPITAPSLDMTIPGEEPAK